MYHHIFAIAHVKVELLLQEVPNIAKWSDVIQSAGEVSETESGFRFACRRCMKVCDGFPSAPQFMDGGGLICKSDCTSVSLLDRPVHKTVSGEK